MESSAEQLASATNPGRLRVRHSRAYWASLLTHHVLTYGLLCVGGALFMFPLIWMMSTSFKDLPQVSRWPPNLLPKPWVFSNYPESLKLLPWGLFLRNTLVITVLNMVGVICSNTLVAYAFARLRFPGRDIMFLVLLATMILPGQVTMIPLYVWYARLGWVNTIKPLVVGSYFAGAFSVFLLRQFFMTIPHELDEAARMDGCSWLGILFKILVPLTKPAIGTLAIFTFGGCWSDFMGPLIYLQDRAKLTLAVGLRMFQTQAYNQVVYMMAMALLIMIPQIVLFFLFQRQMVQGVTLTGIKG